MAHLFVSALRWMSTEWSMVDRSPDRRTWSAVGWSSTENECLSNSAATVASTVCSDRGEFSESSCTPMYSGWLGR